MQFSDARIFLAEQLQPLPPSDQKEWLTNITSHIQSQGLSSPNVEKQHIELAIKVSAQIRQYTSYNGWTYSQLFSQILIIGTL